MPRNNATNTQVVDLPADYPITAYLWYGTSKYDSKLSPETYELLKEFITRARAELSRNSGGFALAEPDTLHMFIAGNGWSIES